VEGLNLVVVERVAVLFWMDGGLVEYFVSIRYFISIRNLNSIV
jgi:hypothetical protein